MYSPKIATEHIPRLYHIREAINHAAGQKVTTMIRLVDEALEAYLPRKEEELHITKHNKVEFTSPV